MNKGEVGKKGAKILHRKKGRRGKGRERNGKQRRKKPGGRREYRGVSKNTNIKRRKGD